RSVSGPPSQLQTTRGLSRQVIAVKVHHFVPGRDKVVDKLLLRIRTCIDLSQSPQLRVRAKNEVDTRAGPFLVARSTVRALVDAVIAERLLCIGHVEQI